MRLAGMIRDEQGFTLQETVVVMIVSSILVGFSYLLFQFVMHFLHTNLETREHRETALHIAAQIFTDIERSRYASVTDSTLVLERAMDGTIVYCCCRGKIVRNGAVISPPDSSVWTANWREFDDSTSTNMRSIVVTLKENWIKGSDSVFARSTMPWSSQGAFASSTERKTQ